jgi:hypothetical protein
MELQDAADRLHELQQVHALVEQENRLLAERNLLLTRIVRPIPPAFRRFVKRLLMRV